MCGPPSYLRNFKFLYTVRQMLDPGILQFYFNALSIYHMYILYSKLLF